MVITRHSIVRSFRFFFARACAHAFGASTISLVISAIVFSQPLSSFAAAPSNKTVSELKGNDQRKKYAAIQTLHKQKGRESRLALKQALASETDPYAKLAILDSLMQSGDPTAVAAVIPLLQDPVVAVRQRAAMALSLLGGTEADAALQGARQDSAVEVRDAALRGAQRTGSGRKRSK